MLTYFFQLNGLRSVFIITLIAMTEKLKVINWTNINKTKNETSHHNFREQKLDVEKRKRQKNKKKISYSQAQKSMWNDWLCHLAPPQTNEKWGSTKLKVKANALEGIKMVKRKRPGKNLLAHCFRLAQSVMIHQKIPTHYF